MKSFATLDFMRYNPTRLIEYTRIVVAAIATNPNYPTPSPTVGVLGSAADALEQAVVKAADGNRADRLLRDASYLELQGLVREATEYINFAANGDRAKLASACVTLNKIPASRPPLQKPQNLKLINSDQRGVIEASVDKVPHAGSYLFQFTTNPQLAEGSWMTMACTQRKCMIGELQPGTEYFIRVAAVGAKEQVMYSDVISKVAA